MSAVTEGSAERHSARRRRRDDGRQERLVGELEELLLAEGFTALTVDDIAARLHCSKTTLYRIASSKEQLVVTVTKHFFRHSAERVETAVGRETDPRRRIATYIAEIGKAMSRHSAAFYADMLGYPPTAEIYRNNADQAARRVSELVHDGVQDGVFRPVDGEFVSRLVSVAIHALGTGSLLESSDLSAGEALTQLSELVINGIAVVPSARGSATP